MSNTVVNIKPEFETGCFTPLETGAIIFFGVVGLTALVIGTLALLHKSIPVDLGKIGMIPLPYAKALIGLAATVVVTDLIFAVLEWLHHKEIVGIFKENFVNGLKPRDFRDLRDKSYLSISFVVKGEQKSKTYSCIYIQQDEGKKVAYYFRTREMARQYEELLNKKDYIELM